MERKIEKCPKCQNYTEGKPVYSQTRQVTRAAVKKGSSKLICTVVGSVIGFFFGGVGCLPGAIIGYIFGLIVSSSETVSNVTDDVDRRLYSSTEFQFDCPCCGYSWMRTFRNGVDTTPDSIIAKQQADLVSVIRNSAFSNTVWAVIWGIITLACSYYCYSHKAWTTYMEYNWLLGKDIECTDYNGRWYLLFFLAFVFFLPTMYCIYNAIDKFIEAKGIEEMTLTDFRNSNYRN